MSLVCSLFRTCLRNICRPASFAHTLNWNVFSTAADSWNTVELGFSFTSRNCGSSNMAGAGGPATMHSQIWKRMIALKRKLLGDSSVLPSAVLETVTKKTRTVLSQQSNSVEMSDYSSGDPEHPRSEQMDYITTPGTTVVVISEDSRQNLNAAEEHCVASASLVSDILPLGDELVALFDSDSHRESSCSTTASSGAKRKKKQKPSKKADSKLRPNYFIAVQITDLDIHKRVGEIQECILKQNKSLKTAMTALPTLHLTLLVIHIADEVQLNRAKIALDESCQAMINLLVKLPTLCISGIDHFQNSVVFAKVQADEAFDQLAVIADVTTDHFQKQGLLSEYSDTKAFHPHLTITKLSKAPRLRKQGIKKIEKSVYEEHSGTVFGCQSVTTLQLCSMTAPKDKESGYYKVVHEVQLQTA